MANRQLILLECVTSHKSPIVRVKPDFSYVHVTNLGEGDEVWLEGANGAQHQKQLQAGLTPFPHTADLTHFVIRKQAGTKPAPTNVEVLRGS